MFFCTSCAQVAELTQTITGIHEKQRETEKETTARETQLEASNQELLLKVTISSEIQKGINAIQQCSIENQKGTIAIDFVQHAIAKDFVQQLYSSLLVFNRTSLFRVQWNPRYKEVRYKQDPLITR